MTWDLLVKLNCLCWWGVESSLNVVRCFWVVVEEVLWLYVWGNEGRNFHGVGSSTTLKGWNFLTVLSTLPYASNFNRIEPIQSWFWHTYKHGMAPIQTNFLSHNHKSELQQFSFFFFVQFWLCTATGDFFSIKFHIRLVIFM